MQNKHYFRALTIAGSDSGGGAGIQADLKTFSALGCFGMSAITALTAQNTVAVTGIYPVSPQFVAQQIDAVLDDIGADAVKIGMLATPDVIAAVADRLTAHKVKDIVLDPVMVAKSGDKLLQDEAVDALKSELLPLATIITPNLPEAKVLCDGRIETREEVEHAARLLADLGPRAVLIKGGHFSGTQSDDCLFIREPGESLHWLKSQRCVTSNTHGTGCTLSSAIAAYLAKGHGILEAVTAAKEYISLALVAGADYKIGHGHGPVFHFYQWWT